MPTQSPLLAEIFRRAPNPKVEGIRISLGALAKSLGVTVPELAPLVREGYLRKRSEENLTTEKTLVDAVPEAAVAWMRSWFMPAQAKPLFSVDNVAELLGVLPREVLPIAAAHDVPCQRDPALGFVFSVWSTRTLLLRVAKGQNVQTVRFDRQALLWRLMEEDPARAGDPPTFDEALEKELARVAKLPADVCGLRTVAILEAMRDAKKMQEAVAEMRTAKASRVETARASATASENVRDSAVTF